MNDLVVYQLYDFGLEVQKQEANKYINRRNALKLSRAISFDKKRDTIVLFLEMVVINKLSIPEPVNEIFLQVITEDTELESLMPFVMGIIGESRS